MSSFTGAFIDNTWSGGDGLESISVINPCTGEECGKVSACGAAQADAALAAAQAAAPGWGKLSIDARAALLEGWKAQLLAHKDEIVALLVAETGKVAGNAGYDFSMLVDCIGFHVQEVRRAYGTVFPSPDDSALSYTRATPVGVTVMVLTWNFPLLNLGYKLGPALATGCTAVVKPSELTPLATSRCLELLAAVDVDGGGGGGFPAGVVNVVNGTGLALVEPLCASKVPRLLACIGSSEMGRRMVGYSAATTVKRFALELGGDAPVLVFADADLDAAVADIVGLKFANGGQICVSPNRVFVHASIYEAFLAKAVDKAAAYAFGSGDDHAPKEEVLQPVATEESLRRLLALVEDATAKGARVLHGGGRVDRAGFFIEPTVLADATDAMACQAAEIFGPILACRSFGSDDEVFAAANDSEWGLSGYVYTRSLSTALRAEQELMCGNVCVNGAHYSIELPHGGLKQSGYGKDISHLALRDYYDIRRITIKR